MNRKIAIITERTDTSLGGAERSVSQLSNALSALDFDVDILAAKADTSAPNVHILCKDIPGRRVCHSTFAKALKKHLAEKHYDIIHSVLPFDFADIYQPRGGSYAESILRNADSFDPSLIASYKKATSFLNFRRTALLRAERKLCNTPNGPTIAALSQYVAEQFRRHYNVNDQQLTVIPNGVATDISPDENASEILRERILTEAVFGKADKPVIFLFAANNFRLKGLTCLIKAMRTASDANSSKHFCLVVVGSGKTDKYRHLAQKYGIEKKIIFLEPVSKIQNLLSIIDVAVLPTFYDPSSRFILEALAAGKPAITTRFNGATDLFVNDKHGKVIDSPRNIDALAEALNFFTNRENIRKTAQAIIDDNIKEKVDINRAAKQLQSIYESILKRKN